MLDTLYGLFWWKRESVSRSYIDVFNYKIILQAYFTNYDLVLHRNISILRAVDS